MKQILLIISLLIGLSSFAQDDFFWSYSHPQTYDVIKFKMPTGSGAVVRAVTNSGDSIYYHYFNDLFFRNIAADSTTQTLSGNVDGGFHYLDSKHNDLRSFSIQLGYGLTDLDLSKVRGLEYLELILCYLPNDFGLDYLDGLRSIYFNELNIGYVDFSVVANLINCRVNNGINLTNMAFNNQTLERIDCAQNPDLISISLGNLNSNTCLVNFSGCKFPQGEVDEVLKWCADGNRTATSGECRVDLTGANMSCPSTTGFTYVDILSSRGWQVAVNSCVGDLPTVNTNNVTLISRYTATVGGNVINQGSSSVTARGACWATTANPTISNSHTTDGTGGGIFTSNITGLAANTIYHARAYATNSYGTSYGSDIQFTTLASQTVPTLTTNAITEVGTATGTSGGVITSDGGAEIIEKGVCWNTTGSPNYNSSKTNEGSGATNFISTVIGLSPSTTYYVRAYARNRDLVGGFYVYATGYGQEEIFMTASDSKCDLPTVTTNAINSITTSSAYGGGNVTSDGGCEVTMKGLCWSTAMNPTTANSHTTDGSGTGTFSSSLTGLSAGYSYYARAYAINSSGTAYGNQVSFTTPCNLPTIAFYACSNATASSVQVSAYISSDGGCAVISRGFDYCTDGNFTTILGSVTVGSGIGSYDTIITGLQCGTRYYFRPWVTTSVGTCYGVNCTDNVGTYCTTSACPTITASLSGYTANPSYPVSIGGYWTVTLSSPAPSTINIPIATTNGTNTGNTNLNVQILAGDTIGETSVNYYFQTTSWTAYSTFGTMPTGYSAGSGSSITIPAYP